MKIVLRRLAIVCSAFLWGFGCQDKDHAFPVKGLDSYTAANIDNQTQEEKYAYTEKHLTTIASGIAQLQDNPLFLDLLYKEVARETWGETSALFSTLFKQAKEKNINLYSLMAPAVDAASLEKSVFAFVGVNNQVYYPQIFIPNFKERGNPAARMGVASPVYVIFNGKSSPDSKYPAYGKDAKGNFVKLGFMVDEAYSLKNEVWVISLNERAIGTGATTNKICAEGQTTGCTPEVPEPPAGPFVPPSEQPPVPGPARTCTFDGNPSMPHAKPDKKGVNVYLDRIAIGCHKEDWISGQSEIYMRLSSIWNTGYNLQGIEDLTPFWEIYSYTDAAIPNAHLPGWNRYIEIDIGLFSRKNVSEFNTFTKGTSLVPQWGGWYTQPYGRLLMPARYDERRNEVVYNLFEFDGWPTGEKMATLRTRGDYVNGTYKINKLNMSYRSEQDPYTLGNFNYYQGSDNYACGEKYADDCSKIEFITRNPTF